LSLDLRGIIVSGCIADALPAWSAGKGLNEHAFPVSGGRGNGEDNLDGFRIGGIKMIERDRESDAGKPKKPWAGTAAQRFESFRDVG
jgi:hypothetical protein